MADDPVRRIPTIVLALIVPVIAVVAVVATQILADDGGSATVPPAGDAIEIKDFTFLPGTLTAAPGATITVTNADGTTHTVTAEDEDFDTGDIGGSAKTTFTAPAEPGTYAYICNIHQYMQGTLEVKG